MDIRISYAAYDFYLFKEVQEPFAMNLNNMQLYNRLF